MLCTGCSGKLSRRAAVRQIQSSAWVTVGANVYVNLGKVAPAGGHQTSKCVQAPSEAQSWAEKHGYVQSAPEDAFSRVTLTPEGQKASVVVETYTENSCDNRTVALKVGKISEVDVTEIFTDGPRAKVEFEYEITPLNHGEDILGGDKIGAAESGEVSVGRENPQGFSGPTASGNFV